MCICLSVRGERNYVYLSLCEWGGGNSLVCVMSLCVSYVARRGNCSLCVCVVCMHACLNVYMF